MAEHTAFFDANVFYPAALRDCLMRLAQNAMFRARWTNRVHEEWTSALLRNRHDLDRGQLERTRKLMDNAIRNCLVGGYEDLIPTLTLPDPDDRHILAAAIRCRADVIGTSNLQDFPDSELSKYKIRAQHPDEFILGLMGRDLGLVVKTAREQRASLKRPPKTANEFLESLERDGLVRVSAELGKRKCEL